MNARRKAAQDELAPVPRDSTLPMPTDQESGELLGSAANYLSAAVFLLQDPMQDRAEVLRRLERADLLIREATRLMDLVQRHQAQD